MEKVIKTARISSWHIIALGYIGSTHCCRSTRKAPQVAAGLGLLLHKKHSAKQSAKAKMEMQTRTLSMEDDMSRSKILNALVSAKVVLQCCSNLYTIWRMMSSEFPVGTSFGSCSHRVELL